MKDRTPHGELEALQKFQKALSPERAFKIVNDAVNARLVTLKSVLPDENILVKLDIALPW